MCVTQSKKTKTTTATRLTALAVMTINFAGAVRAAEPVAAPSVKPGIEKCTVTTPQGEFAQVRIEFDAPVPWTLLATMRDGRIRVDDLLGLIEPGGWLEIKNGKIRGSFQRFIPGSYGKGGINPVSAKLRMHRFDVEGTVTGDKIAGSFKVPTAAATEEKTTGTITGMIVRETVLAKDNALPANVSWDSFLGSAGMGGAAVSTDTILLGIDRARLAWRSEEPIGQGLSPLTRFMYTFNDAARLRTSSGSFSPVLGDGKVFCFLRVPRVGPVGKHHGEQSVDYETDAKKAGLEKAPLYVNEKGFEIADEVVVAMDATTGKTLWRAVIGIGVPNVQGHKERRSDRTPCYADGKVFVPGRAGYVYALDAKTGAPLWQSPYRVDDGLGLVATEEVVVVPGDNARWIGLDPKTGTVLWTGKGKGMTWTPSRWVHGGKTYIVAVVNLEPSHEKPPKAEIHCLDSKTGVPLWTQPVPELFSHAGVTVTGDLLMGYFDLLDPATRKKGDGVEADGSRIGMGKPSVRAYQLSTKGAEQRWEYPGVGHPYAVPVVVAGKYAFVCSAGEILFTGRGNMKAVVIELATGKVTDEQSIVDADGGKFLPCNGGYVQALGNMVYTRIDGTHGGNAFVFYEVSPSGKIVTKTPWAPPQYGGQTHTTSYHHPIMYALADGRMYLRQYDGIYCYDLRADVAAQKVEKALRAVGDDPVKMRDALCALGQDANPAVRQEAAWKLALHAADGKAGKPTPVLLQVLASAGGNEPTMDEMLAKALAVFGSDSLPVLASVAKEQDPARRVFAMQTAARMGNVTGPAMDELVMTGLRDKDSSVIDAALKAAENRGAAGTVFMPELVRLADALPVEQAMPATRALMMVLPRGEKPSPMPGAWDAKLVALLNLWGQDDMLGRVIAAIHALGPDEAYRVFTTALDGDDALKALRACDGLAALGAKGVPAIPKIEQAKERWKNSLSFGRAADSAVKKLQAAGALAP